MRLTRWILIGLGCLLVAVAVYLITRPAAIDRRSSAASDSWLLDIRDSTDFNALQGPPLTKKIAKVRSVKLVYSLKNDTLYFVGNQLFRYHFDFCRSVLGYEEPLMVFNALNYGESPGQSFLLANLNYYSNLDIYALEFTSSTRMSVENIRLLANAVRHHSFIDVVNVQISTDYLAQLHQSGQLDLPVVTASTLYAGQTFQPIRTGSAYGRLHFMDKGYDITGIHAGDICVFHGSPVTVPICGMILTDAIQSPLSHIQLLCHARKIPAASQADIWKMKDRNGAWVHVVIDERGLNVEEVTEQTAVQLRNKDQQRDTVPLQYDLSVRELTSITDKKLTAEAFGRKAHGLSNLAALANRKKSIFKIPEGAFAIPFSYYHAHLEKAGVLSTVKDLHLHDQDLTAKLKTIREAITSQPVDPGLVKKVRQRMIAAGCGKTFRFRSSSNAEDAPGFSGAGLYESKTATTEDIVGIEKAILKVWASAWNEAAFNERELYGIHQEDVMMGILVHRSFPDEAINGVAVTKNFYRPDFAGFTVSIQQGDISVVNPPEETVPEQFICMASDRVNMLSNDVSVEYITYSSLHPGSSMLTHEQVIQLHGALEMIMNSNSTPMDVEFKWDRNGQLYLKQMRPYQ